MADDRREQREARGTHSLAIVTGLDLARAASTGGDESVPIGKELHVVAQASLATADARPLRASSAPAHGAVGLRGDGADAGAAVGKVAVIRRRADPFTNAHAGSTRGGSWAKGAAGAAETAFRLFEACGRAAISVLRAAVVALLARLDATVPARIGPALHRE